jgi:adenylate cyclase
MIDLPKIEIEVRESYNKAKENINLIKKAMFHESAISDRIPGYKANRLQFGNFEKDNFSVLFIDIRQSTQRARVIGPEKTFLSMHAFIPAMLAVINYHKGYVIDIMGDGIMVFFGGKHSENNKTYAAQIAGLCGLDMLNVVKNVVNKILDEDKIWLLTCGIGIDYGDVIVTKIGIDDVYDVKSYGDCINTAAKYAQRAENEVIVSKGVMDLWPSGENGRMRFKQHNSEGYLLYKNSN